jgi:uncharacterized protein
MKSHTILWRRLDQPGHESCRLSFRDSEWRLAGTAVFAHEGRACRLDYQVVCDASWQTVSGSVTGWVGEEEVKVEVAADTARGWCLNGRERPEAAGCTDLDLNFSPSTNLLSIRRLGLNVDQVADVRAAWLRFPSFKLEPLAQTYRRPDVDTYVYESGGGSFVAELRVNEAGFVIHYPNLWQAEEVG